MSAVSPTTTPNLPIGTTLYWRGGVAEFHGFIAGTDAAAIIVYDEHYMTVVKVTDLDTEPN